MPYRVPINPDGVAAEPLPTLSDAASPTSNGQFDGTRSGEWGQLLHWQEQKKKEGTDRVEEVLFEAEPLAQVGDVCAGFLLLQESEWCQ